MKTVQTIVGEITATRPRGRSIGLLVLCLIIGILMTGCAAGGLTLPDQSTNAAVASESDAASQADEPSEDSSMSEDSAASQAGEPSEDSAASESDAASQADEPSEDSATSEDSAASQADEPSEDSAAIDTSEPQFVDFDPNNFDNSTNINNEWFPMQPGTHWAYEGFTVEEGESIPHRIEFTITDLTKEIEGVRTVVAWIVDISDDEVVEKEIAFYAQDNDGNVWYMGEYPEEYENGEFVAAPTWISGLADARAGIKMKAEPQPGMPSYFQGWGPEVEWTDYGQVEQVGQETSVAFGDFDDVLVIAESSLEETDAFQLKYYARGVGEVRVGWKGEDATQEELELVEFTQLDPEALAEVRAEALALEKHAYEISQDVYAHTPPAEQIPGAE